MTTTITTGRVVAVLPPSQEGPGLVEIRDPVEFLGQDLSLLRLTAQPTLEQSLVTIKKGSFLLAFCEGFIG